MKKIHISLAVLISISPFALQVCAADEAAASQNDCTRAPAENPALCMDAACAARAKAELERTLACHKAKMSELAAQAAMPVTGGLGGSK